MSIEPVKTPRHPTSVHCKPAKDGGAVVYAEVDECMVFHRAFSDPEDAAACAATLFGKTFEVHPYDETPF